MCIHQPCARFQISYLIFFILYKTFAVIVKYGNRFATSEIAVVNETLLKAYNIDVGRSLYKYCKISCRKTINIIKPQSHKVAFALF